MYGPQDTLPLTAMYYPLETDEGLANLLARFSQVGRYLDQQMASLEEGRAKGEVSPKQNVKLVIAQIDALLAKDGARSDFQPPPEKLEKLSSERRALVTSKIAKSLTRDVLPPLRKYRTYLSDKLLPVARVEPGLSALPQGAACYAATIRNHTGLPLTPKELHEMGLNLLAGIEKEEEAIAIAEGAKLRPDGHADLKAFEKSVGKRPDQTLKTGEELMAWAWRTIDRAMAALPRDFKTLPQRPLIVKAIEPWRADSNGASYQQATDDGQTPALYYIPTTKPETRTLYDQEATVFHEGVPGHHLQVSIGQSLQGLPSFAAMAGALATSRVGRSTPSNSPMSSSSTRAPWLATGCSRSRRCARCNSWSTPGCTRCTGPATRRWPSTWPTPRTIPRVGRARSTATSSGRARLWVTWSGSRRSSSFAPRPRTGSGRPSTCATSTTPSSCTAPCRCPSSSRKFTAGSANGWRPRRRNKGPTLIVSGGAGTVKSRRGP